jgi:MOSC domain-containing protein YiiM
MTNDASVKIVSIALSRKKGTRKTGVVEITQIGKTCHKKCAIYYQAGDCIMPREGVFARVIIGGRIRVDDTVMRLDTAERLS